METDKIASFNQFTALDIRVGTVTKCQEFVGARKPAFQLWIDFGEKLGVLKTSAQIADLYDTDVLVGKQVVAVVNFGEKQIGNFMSQCLVLGSYTEDGVVLLQTERPVKNGAKIG